MTILVTGATGNVGHTVAGLLREAGAPVRTCSRKPDLADVRLDLGDPSTFGAALEGVQKVFLYVTPQGAQAFAQAAKQAGVRHVVVLSSLAAAHPSGGGFDAVRQVHVAVEDAVEEAGIDWTFLRPGGFDTNTLQWAQSIKDESVVRLPHPESNSSPIHERDIAEVGVRALLDDGHRNTAYLLSGPQELTARQQAEIIGDVLGRQVEVEHLDHEAALAHYRRLFGPLAPDSAIENLLEFTAQSVGKPSEVYDTVERVTGRKALTFEQWVIDHKADFS